MSVRHEEQHPDTLLLADLERLGEQIPGGFFVYRAEEPQEMLYVNLNVLRIFVCDTLEEYKALTGYTFRGLVHPEDFDAIQSSIDEQIADTANDNLDYVEYRIVRRDGEVRWIDDYGHFTYTDDYGGVYYVFISDITDKRHAQEEHFRAELELEREKRANEIRSGLLAGISHDIRSREGHGTSVTVDLPLQLAAHNRRVQFESVFDLFSLFGGGTPVYLFDFHTQTARFSPALLDALGAPDAQSSGANGIYFWADYIHPDDRERFMRTIWEANELKQISFDLKCRMRVRGVYHPVRFLGGVTKDPDGNPDFLGLIMKNEELADMTDPVTGLPPRRRFLLALQEGVKSILLLRVGRLDRVNEGYGSEVLRRVGRSLRDAVGGSGTVCRLEGAEFAVLSDRLGEEEMRALYGNLRDTLYRAIEIDGVTHRLLAFGGLLLRAEKPALNEREVCDCLENACAESEQQRQGELVVLREAGSWILRSAMMDGRLFLNADPDFTVCVNVSPEQITDVNFAETAAELAAQTGFPLNRLCLELCGDCRRLGAERLRNFAAPLRAPGVRIGIDDFGSGDAWLDALRDLPLRGMQGRCFSEPLYFDDVLALIEARDNAV